MELREEHLGMENIKTIPLSNTQLYAIIDVEDYERVKKLKWHVYKSGKGRVCGAAATITKSSGILTEWVSNKHLKLHRYVMQLADPKLLVDHINRDVFDNRKCNLRICTANQNNANIGKYKNNTSGFKGVLKRKNRWVVRFRAKGHPEYHSSYVSLAKAVYAYDNKAIEIYGEYACTNKMLFPNHDFFVNPEAYQ